MRSLFKYLLGLVGLLTLSQGTLAASVQSTEMPHVTSRLTATADCIEFVSDAYATPHVWHAHATALGIFQFEAVELTEEDDRWNVNAFQFPQGNGLSQAWLGGLTQYHLHYLPQFTTSPTPSQGFRPTLSSCLAFCVFRI